MNNPPKRLTHRCQPHNEIPTQPNEEIPTNSMKRLEKNMKSIGTKRLRIAAAFAGVLTLGLAACSSGDDTPTTTGSATTTTGGDPAEQYELIVGATSSSASLEVEALNLWADGVAERTDGQLTVTILPDGQLGSELETQEAIISGDVQGVSGGVTGVPQLDFLAAAYVFRDAEHMMDVLRSDITDPWRAAWIEQSGIDIVGVFERLPRTLTSNVRVETPDDAIGLDIRVPGTEFQIAIWEAVGATPISIPSQEVYSALETGVVEAQENALDTAYAAGVAEVQDYVVYTEHTYMPQFVGISQDYLDSLPDGFEDIVREEMTVAENWLSEQLDTALPEILADMESQGAEIIYPEIDAFRAKMFPVTEAYAEDIWGPGVLAQIQAY